MKKSRLIMGLILCAIIVSGVFASCKGQQKKADKVIGLQLYSVRDLMKEDALGTLKAVAEMGYKEVELANYGGGKFYGMEPADFKKAVEDLGMTIISSHVNRGLNKENPAETMEWWNQTIAAHKAAGIQYMVMPSPPMKLETMENLSDMVAYMNQIGAKADSAGIRFGYHNHSKEFEMIDSVVIFDYLMENTDPALVMFELDVYWAQHAGVDPIALINKYPERIQLLHIKDVKEIGASGTMDFKGIYEAAYATGNVKGFIVEQEDYSAPVLESVKQSFDYLNNADFVKNNADVVK